MRVSATSRAVIPPQQALRGEAEDQTPGQDVSFASHKVDSLAIKIQDHLDSVLEHCLAVSQGRSSVSGARFDILGVENDRLKGSNDLLRRELAAPWWRSLFLRNRLYQQRRSLKGIRLLIDLQATKIRIRKDELRVASSSLFDIPQSAEIQRRDTQQDLAALPSLSADILSRHSQRTIGNSSPGSLWQINLSNQEHAPIARLPTEILQQIIGQLPLSSEALFALTCKRFKFFVGGNPMIEMRGADQQVQRDEFLVMLSKSLLNRVACRPCSRLHLMTGQLECWEREGYYSPRMQGQKSSSRIYFHQLRFMVQNTAPGIASTFISWSKTMRLGEFNRNRSEVYGVPANPLRPGVNAQLKIVNKRLIVMQNTYVKFDMAYMAFLPPRGWWRDSAPELVIRAGTCWHRSDYYYVLKNLIRQVQATERESYHQQPSKPIQMMSMVYRCRFCPREVVFAIRIKADRSLEDTCQISMFTWTDLGGGEPGDKIWERVRNDEGSNNWPDSNGNAKVHPTEEYAPDELHLSSIIVAFTGDGTESRPKGYHLGQPCLNTW